LESAAGEVLIRRDPRRAPIVIDVIDELLVTTVTSRPLTADEIISKGIVIDEENYEALSFSVGLTVGGKEVVVDLPVVFPTRDSATAGETPMQMPPLTSLGPTMTGFDELNIPNLSMTAFSM